MEFILGMMVVVLAAIVVYQYVKLKKQATYVEVINSMKDMIYYCDVAPSLRYRFLSDSVDVQLGEGSKEQHYKQPYLIMDIIHPEDRHLIVGKLNGDIDFRQPITMRVRHANGEYYWFEEVSTPIYENGELARIVGVYRRIDDRMKKFKEIEYELSYDTLTTVYNRAYFEKMMAYYNRKSLKVGLAIIDLDNLKLVNDRLGHRAGDEFIHTVATILKHNACEYISVCRIGGDEFAVFFENATDELIEQYFQAVDEELSLHQQPIFTTNIQFSKGYAISDDSFEQMKTLYEQADENMYNDKHSKHIRVEYHI